MSKDMTRGYGPVEYLIKRTRKGEYKIKAQLQSITLNGVLLSCTIYTHFGHMNEEETISTVWLSQIKQTVEIATINVN